MMEGKPLVLDTERMVPEAARDQETRRTYGVKSSVIMPLTAGGGPLIGVLSFDTMREERAWPHDLLQRLGLVAQICANAIVRKNFEQSQRESEARVRLAAHAAGAGLWVMTLANQNVWATPRLRELYSFLPEESLTYQSFLEAIHPDDRTRVGREVARAVQSGIELNLEYRIVSRGRTRWLISRGRAYSPTGGAPDRVMGATIDITEHRETEAALRDLSGRLLQAQEDERTRIAKELHDGVSQALSLLAVEFDLLARQTPDLEQLRAHMVDFSARVKGLLAEVHQLSHALHPAKLEQLGLAAALGGLCRDFQASGVTVRFESAGVPRTLENEVALCFYRVCQEALQNVLKHAGVKRALVVLNADIDGLHMSIRDEGRGFDLAARSGQGSLGLVSMRERVRMVRGEIEWETQPGYGTVVSVRVPFQRTESQ
jgi:PAS domain S-box-containing protein